MPELSCVCCGEGGGTLRKVEVYVHVGEHEAAVRRGLAGFASLAAQVKVAAPELRVGGVDVSALGGVPTAPVKSGA